MIIDMGTGIRDIGCSGGVPDVSGVFQEVSRSVPSVVGGVTSVTGSVPGITVGVLCVSRCVWVSREVFLADLKMHLTNDHVCSLLKFSIINYHMFHMFCLPVQERVWVREQGIRQGRRMWQLLTFAKEILRTIFLLLLLLPKEICINKFSFCYHHD